MHSTIEILAYRTIGVIITVNLQHNLPKWVCGRLYFPPNTPIQPLLIYDSSCIALCCQSVAAVSNF